MAFPLGSVVVAVVIANFDEFYVDPGPGYSFRLVSKTKQLLLIPFSSILHCLINL